MGSQPHITMPWFIWDLGESGGPEWQSACVILPGGPGENDHRGDLCMALLGLCLAFWAEKEGSEAAFVIVEYRRPLAVEGMLE